VYCVNHAAAREREEREKREREREREEREGGERELGSIFTTAVQSQHARQITVEFCQNKMAVYNIIGLENNRI